MIGTAPLIHERPHQYRRPIPSLVQRSDFNFNARVLSNFSVRDALLEVKEIEQLALIDRLPTHHDPPAEILNETEL